MSVRSRMQPASDDLIGRDEELSALAEVIQAGRVVTLVGPAGVGKTRLARAAPRVVGGRRSCWVDVSEDAPPSLADVVARALGLTAPAEQDLSRQLLDRLADEPTLLILDDCEHVLDAAAEFVEHVCVRSPQTAVLATSRERLSVPDEMVFPVAPLAVPPADGDADGIAASPAVQLLVRRAAQLRPKFQLSADKAPAAARICRRLDGLPLSIELAASRLEALTLFEVADGLDDVFALLGNGGRRGRHRSLTAALDWSHDLLDARERALFRRLAVFPSSFTFDAAVDVAGSSGDPLSPGRSGILDVLSRLIAKSFLTVSYADASARYQMLYVVREYAREKLQESGEQPTVAAAHQRYYAAFVGRQAALLGRRGEAYALARLDTEIDNVDAAVRHASQFGPADAALELGTSLWRFCYLRGHYRCGRDWLEVLHPLADTVDSPARHARMLHGDGMLAFLQCDYTPATRAFESALALFRSAADPAGTADSLLALAGVAREQRRYDRAQDLYAETLRVCAEAGLAAQRARARNYLAFLAWLRTEYGRAEDLGQQALREFSVLGDHEGACWAWINIGSAQLHLDDLDGARLALAEARRIAEAISYREGRAWLDHLTALLDHRSRSSHASALLRSALAGHRDLGDRWRVASVLADLAVAYVERSPDTSAALFGRADAVWEEIESGPAPYERPRQDAARASAAAALGQRGYAAAWRLGHTAQPDQTLPGEVTAPADGTAVLARSTSADARAAIQAGPTVSGAPHGVAAPIAMELTALGHASVRRGGRELVAADWGYAKPRDLLFLLACATPLSKDQIGLRLWPDLDPRQLRNALHTALRDLRKALGDPDWVVYTDGRYALDLGHGPARFDVTDFETALAGARASADADVTLRQLQAAITLYRGDLLPAVDADWVVARRSALRRAYVGALLDAGGELTRRRDPSGAASFYTLAVQHDPFLEVAHRELMRSWARCGEPSRAVEHFRNYAVRLKRELGTAPAAETRQLYQRLLTHSSR